MYFWPCVLLVAVLTCLIGCDSQPRKTDSEIFRANAIAEAQVPIDDANTLLTDTVKNAPLSNLDTLVMLNNAIKDAQQIYRKYQIAEIQDPRLTQLDEYLTSLEPKMIERAKTLLHQAIDETLQLRTQIEDAKNRPYSARDTDTTQLVDYLGENYNKTLAECCSDPLAKIDKLLHRNVKSHRATIVMIRGLNNDLAKVIKDKAFAAKLRSKIEAL